MPLTRDMESPLLSEDEVLRRAALLQLSSKPSPEAAKALIFALIHFLKERPQVAEEFEQVLYTPPLAPLAEEPVLHLLEEPDHAVREEAAFILFRMKIRASSRARVARALEQDPSPWVRAYAAKALAMLQGAAAGELLAEAIDNEATLEAIARLGEALALTGDARLAGVLRDQAEQLRERSAPADAGNADVWLRAAGEVALLLEALAAHLSGEGAEGSLVSRGPELFAYRHPEHGEILVAGGPAHFGYAARVHRGGSTTALRLDSPSAQELLAKVSWP